MVIKWFRRRRPNKMLPALRVLNKEIERDHKVVVNAEIYPREKTGLWYSFFVNCIKSNSLISGQDLEIDNQCVIKIQKFFGCNETIGKNIYEYIITRNRIHTETDKIVATNEFLNIFEEGSND